MAQRYREYDYSRKRWKYLRQDQPPPADVLEGGEVWVWRVTVRPRRWEIIGRPQGSRLDDESTRHLAALRQAHAEGWRAHHPGFNERLEEIRREQSDTS